MCINIFLYRLEGDLLRQNAEFEKLESKARRERLTLENQLDVEKARFDAEKKKLQTQLDASSKEKVHPYGNKPFYIVLLNPASTILRKFTV